MPINNFLATLTKCELLTYFMLTNFVIANRALYATDNSISNNYSEAFPTENSMLSNNAGTFTSDM